MFDTSMSDPNGVQRFTGEGRHHLHVVDVIDDGDKWEVYYQSLASDNPADVGAKGKETLWKPNPSKPDFIAGAINKALHFCCAVGLYSKERWAADKTAGRPANCDPVNAKGREFIAKVTVNEKGYPKLAMTWPTNDKAVADVPRGKYEAEPAMAGAGAGTNGKAAGDAFDF